MAKLATVIVGADTIRFEWSDESTDVIAVESFSDELRKRAELHGFTQKLRDSYAGAKSIGEAKEKFAAVLEALAAGDWNRSGGTSTGGIWVEAIVRATGEDFDIVLAKWNAMDDETKKGVKAHPQIKAIKAEIDLERAKARAKAQADVETPVFSF